RNELQQLYYKQAFRRDSSTDNLIQPGFQSFRRHQIHFRQFAGVSYAAGLEKKVGIPQNWDTLYQIAQEDPSEQLSLHHSEKKEDPSPATEQSSTFQEGTKQFFQLHNRFIVSQIHSGFMLIDQQAAHERILFEHYLEQLTHNQGISQQSLF